MDARAPLMVESASRLEVVRGTIRNASNALIAVRTYVATLG